MVSIQSQVINRMLKIANFGHEDQSFEKQVANPHPSFLRFPLPPAPLGFQDPLGTFCTTLKILNAELLTCLPYVDANACV